LKWMLVGLLGLLVLGGAAAGGYWYLREARIDQFAQTPFGTEAPKVVDIPTGTGPRRLATLLAEAEVVQSADDFYAFLRKEQLGPKLKAGEYAFAGALTPRQVAGKLAAGEVKVYRFTIPEGLRAEEILPLIAGSELKLDLARLTALVRDPAFLKKAKVPADRIEGFLYPDTYTFTRNATEEAVLSKMIARALEEYARADAQRQPGIRLSLLETFTLASIIEKETGAPQERPRISCVFHNRLKKDWKLGTDPTVLYAMALLRGRWVNNITKKDLETPHPYNTYTTRGLPPGPIASPGAAALKAALDPIRCDDYFFVSRNDGTHVFCPDLACHEAAVEKWQREYFRKKRARGASADNG
jgi:UPF0755 protein